MPTKPAAPPAPASPPPRVNRHDPSPNPREEAAPFTHDDVIALARVFSANAGDNPDNFRFGVRRYEEHIPMAKLVLVGITWWEQNRGQ